MATCPIEPSKTYQVNLNFQTRAVFVDLFSTILPQNQSFLMFVLKHPPKLAPFTGGMKLATTISPLYFIIMQYHLGRYQENNMTPFNKHKKIKRARTT